MLWIACRLRTESLTWITSAHDLRNLMNRQEFDSDVWSISDDDASRWSRLNYKTLHANSRTFVFIALEIERGQSASYHRKVKLIESEAIKKNVGVAAPFREAIERRNCGASSLSPQWFYWNIFPSTISTSIICSRSASRLSWSCIMNGIDRVDRKARSFLQFLFDKLSLWTFINQRNSFRFKAEELQNHKLNCLKSTIEMCWKSSRNAWNSSKWIQMIFAVKCATGAGWKMRSFDRFVTSWANILENVICRESLHNLSLLMLLMTLFLFDSS